MSFVYFEAKTSQGQRTVPSRRFATCPVPYYADYSAGVRDEDMVIYNVKMRNCSDGTLVDKTQDYTGALVYTHPREVAAGLHRLARASVVYALDVSLNPNVFLPGQPTHINAAIADDFITIADQTLSIAIDPTAWRVTAWSIDYGDGRQDTKPGGAEALSVEHRYLQAAQVKPRVTAHVAGIAQVADFNEATGDIFLLDEPFMVDVSNDASGVTVVAPVVAHQPPATHAAVSPRLEPGVPAVDARGADRIEVPRGTPVYLYVRPAVDTEGQMTLNGRPAGAGHTVVRSWKLTSGSPDGPPGQVSAVGAEAPAGTPIVQQWDHPDRIGTGGAEPYLVRVEYVVRTTYPDGQSRDFSFAGPIAVVVGFAASSG
ncbi:MAG: hypothetical protein QOE92_2588 [Chloroflexota bacterium]|nr:hypothetical protein [Chloroflexota bacterium]